jgi:hypothetical protein
MVAQRRDANAVLPSRVEDGLAFLYNDLFAVYRYLCHRVSSSLGI